MDSGLCCGMQHGQRTQWHSSNRSSFIFILVMIVSSSFVRCTCYHSGQLSSPSREKSDLVGWVLINALEVAKALQSEEAQEGEERKEMAKGGGTGIVASPISCTAGTPAQCAGRPHT